MWATAPAVGHFDVAVVRASAGINRDLQSEFRGPFADVEAGLGNVRETQGFLGDE